MMQRQHQLLLLSITCIASSNAFQTPLNLSTRNNISHLPIKLSHPTQLQSASAESAENNNAAPTDTAGTSPTTFREAEVLGLRYMQDGRYDEALKAFKLAMSLPGSRPDILRKANISGPSPVGGSSGGTTDKFVRTLDEFEYQAAHYNLACTYACLGDVGESVNNLRKAFENGFDNYATVRADPDLAGVRESKEFERLMDEFDHRRGFNPFSVFGS
ncbi:hypothetical protein ACHAXN_009450 [Cyclotella atomus]